MASDAIACAPWSACVRIHAVGPRLQQCCCIAYSDAVESAVLHAVLETSIFSRRVDALLSREERAELIETLARNPRDGDVVPGLGGVRKLRFAPKGRGRAEPSE